MANARIKDCGEDSYDYMVEQAAMPVLVQFWAPWCEPCARLTPVLEELAEEVGEQAAIVRVNTQEYPELAYRQQVKGTPTVKIYQPGAAPVKLAGFRTKEELLKLLLPARE